MACKMPSPLPRDERESGSANKQRVLHADPHQAIASGAGHADDERSDRETYAVGYGRPPLHSRFKPGQSGNPKGRPKQSRNMRSIVKQVLSEDMQIREGGRLRRMPAMEALVRTVLARSFKGDPKALASLIVLMRQSGLSESDENSADLLHGPEYEEIIADFLARNGVGDPASDDDVDSPVSSTATSKKRG